MPQQQRHLPPIGRADRRPGPHWQVQRASCRRATVPPSPLMILGDPWAYKGGPWGACGLNGLKLAMASFKSCWAANSLNGLKRLNGAGELPRSMVREAPGRRRRPGSWLQSASTRPLCEYGSCQCTRLTDVSSEAGLCLITAVLEKTARNPATHAGEADFLKRS